MRRMELLAPAGDLEKLEGAYTYGADAAYIGLAGFSLRRRADEVALTRLGPRLRDIKGNRRLYGALNISFHNADLRALEAALDEIAALPLDAVIVSDLGVVPLLRARLPGVELHLSTQANCLNTAAARVYQDLGFSRIIPAREMSLDDLCELKSTLPDLEIEVFVHGAMCVAYSGRCLLSAWQAGRSANKGDCAQSCRWGYRYAIEEAERPGEYFPVEEHDGFSTVLSSKDLCMIDHLGALAEAGIDAVKIEGRMKSVYYTAMVTRAYRKEIDRIAHGAPRGSTAPFIAELANVSHRELSTGFYFGDPNATVPAGMGYRRSYRFLARIGEAVAPGRYGLDVKNGFGRADPIEYVGPNLPFAADRAFRLFDETGAAVDRITHQAGGVIEPGVRVEPGYLIRMLDTRADS